MSDCVSPLSDDALLDWWSGELEAARARQVEEHLLSCPACSGRAHAMSAVALSLRGLVRHGGAMLVLLPVVLERLRHDGRRAREYRAAPGKAVHCTLGPDDDMVLARLAVDLRGVSRLDLVARTDDGPERRLRDVPFDASSGELVVMPATEYLRARPRHVERMRLLAVEPGGERLLGEYTFDHTPWPGR